MERKTLVTSGQTQYPGTSTPRELGSFNMLIMTN